jgi:hypothetical protein
VCDEHVLPSSPAILAAQRQGWQQVHKQPEESYQQGYNNKANKHIINDNDVKINFITILG